METNEPFHDILIFWKESVYVEGVGGVEERSTLPPLFPAKTQLSCRAPHPTSGLFIVCNRGRNVVGP